jgi:phosphoribosylaminoimidazolecarboxamide formyltransferase/IMP cyclohydrolase
LPSCRASWLRLVAEHGKGGVATAQQHHGKEMSYNNYLDADAAYSAGARSGNQMVVIHS